MTPCNIISYKTVHLFSFVSSTSEKYELEFFFFYSKMLLCFAVNNYVRAEAHFPLKTLSSKQ